MIKKRSIIMILIILVVTLVLYGCGSKQANNNNNATMNMTNSEMKNMKKWSIKVMKDNTKKLMDMLSFLLYLTLKG